AWAEVVREAAIMPLAATAPARGSARRFARVFTGGSLRCRGRTMRPTRQKRDVRHHTGVDHPSKAEGGGWDHPLYDRFLEAVNLALSWGNARGAGAALRLSWG